MKNWRYIFAFCILFIVIASALFFSLFPFDNDPSSELPPLVNNAPTEENYDVPDTPVESTEGLIFKKYGDSYMVSGYSGTASEITIGNIYDGLPINAISARVFSDNQTIESVKIINNNIKLGEYLFSGCSNLKTVSITNGITKIPTKCFENCTSLTEIKIPKTVTVINKAAFKGCSSLTRVTFPESLTIIITEAFMDCEKLYNIKLPNGIEDIGSYAFNNTSFYNTQTNWESGALYIGKYLISVDPYYSGKFTIDNGIKAIAGAAFENCSEINEVIIPEGITVIPSSCFKNCTALTEVIIPDSVKRIEYSAFMNCAALEEIDLPQSIENLGGSSGSTFSGCISLNKITIPSGITELGYGIFKGCENLEEINIPETLTTINSRAFSGCVSLKSIDLPERLKTLRENSFEGCTKLEKIHIKKNLNSLGTNVFYNCDSLSEITISPENTYFAADGNCLINLKTKTLLAVFGEFQIPLDDRIANIPGDFLCTIPNLKSFTVSRYIKGVRFYTSAGYMNIFIGCKDLESITVEAENPDYYSLTNCVIDKKTGDIVVGCGGSIIPKDSKVTCIKQNAFCGTENLKSITIPKNLKKIEIAAFGNCNNLTDVYYEGTKAEWDAIATNGWNNYGCEKVILHCADGDYEIERSEIAFF